MSDERKKGAFERTMAAAAHYQDTPPELADRPGLTLALGEMAEAAGADFYMLLTTVSRDRRLVGRIISANWVFDAIQLVGPETLGELTRGGLALFPGGRPQPLDTSVTPAAQATVPGEAIALLNSLGHAELYCLRLNVGRYQAHLILSGRAGAIDAGALTSVQMRCNYLLSAMSPTMREATLENGLSPRERECLAWAAEGKTSEEIALILGVQASAANTAISVAMEKLHARNRVEAVASAIRTGIL